MIFLENKDRRCDFYLHDALKMSHYFKPFFFFFLFFSRIMLCYVSAVYGN